MSPAVVDVFIAGMQKSGTTMLYSTLGSTPGIQVSDVKEPHFFDDESIDWTSPDPTKLHRHFDWSSDNLLRAEATPIYMFWPNSLRRLAAYNPDAIVIVVMKHPAYRAWSHWSMETARGHEAREFSRAISDELSGDLEGASEERRRRHSYLGRGWYSRQCSELLSLFPRNQAYFTTTDDLWHTPNVVMDEVSKLLQVDIPTQPRISHRSAPPLKGVDLDLATLCTLSEYFASDIAATARITGMDLRPWTAAKFAEYLAHFDSDLQSAGPE
jgi:hypothetical protein